jgi:hypothetical protein
VKIFAAAGAAALLALASCGLEEYYYLPSVPQENITVTLTDQAAINLPNISTGPGDFYYFKTFTIFYRIYISKEFVSSVSANNTAASNTELSNINNALLSDYNAIKPSTDITSSSANTAVGSLFKTRGFYEMGIEEGNIRDILYNARGSSIVLDFPVTGEIPSLSINGSKYPLRRSNGDGVFTPAPNRYFLNTADINASANVKPTINADVADNSGIPASPRYTYIALYIALEGLDDRTFGPMYGKPTFIGVLKLPESNP